MNSTESQRSNLRIKPVAANLPVTQKNTIISAAQSTVTTAIASRTRLRRRDRDLPLHTARPRIKRAKHIKCHKFGCPVNNYTLDDKGSFKYKHIKYHNVPKYPPELKGKPHKLSVVRRQIKIFHRREMMRRMGLNADENKKSFRICEYHNFAHETHWENISHGNKS